MEILTYGNPILRRKSRIVKPGDPDVAEGLLEQMILDMHSTGGIGLAAPQVGILKRIVVIDIPTETDGALKLINPKITWASEEKGSCTEGCLSLPGIFETIERPASVSVEYQDENFNPCVIEKAQGILAVCLQHEIDHLDGIVFIDHLDRAQKSKLAREFKKRQAEEALIKSESKADVELMGEWSENEEEA